MPTSLPDRVYFEDDCYLWSAYVLYFELDFIIIKFNDFFKFGLDVFLNLTLN